jgi:hypothetical protein
VAVGWSEKSLASGGGEAVAARSLRVGFWRGEEECGATSDSVSSRGS